MKDQGTSGPENNQKARWFDEVGDEDNPNSIVLRITLTEGVIIDNAEKGGETKYEIDFINKTAK